MSLDLLFSKHMATTEIHNLSLHDALPISLDKPPFMPWLPTWLWNLQRRMVNPLFIWVTVGLYDQPVRDLLGYEWSARDAWLDRKSTRLNSSHVSISYAVFCLKKKNNNKSE